MSMRGRSSRATSEWSRIALAAWIVLGAQLSGCQQPMPEREPEPQSEQSAAASETQPAAAEDQAEDDSNSGQPNAQQVPVEEDFVPQAERQIDADNYRAELEKLEAELK